MKNINKEVYTKTRTKVFRFTKVLLGQYVRYRLDDPSSLLFEPNNDPNHDTILPKTLLVILFTVSHALLQ